jgi:hypothetical protein
LFSSPQLSYSTGDDRERLARAREAAEALFTSKPPAAEGPASQGAAPGEQTARKPRVLAILPRAPARQAPPAAPVARAPRKPRGISRSQHARIRTWVEYGMTAAEVAEVYGAAIGDIERILMKA